MYKLLFPFMLLSMFVGPLQILDVPCTFLAWSPDGRELACFYAPEGAPTQLYVLDINGSYFTPLAAAVAGSVDWSPDSIRLVFVAKAQGREQPDLFSIGRDGSALTRLTNGPETESNPQWSPDGAHIAFVRSTGADRRVWVIDADGTDAWAIEEGSYAPAWSPTGAQLAYLRDGVIQVMPGTGGDPQIVGGANADSLSWSPDGAHFTYIAFGWNGSSSLHLIDADGNDPREMVDRWNFCRHHDPDWSPDGSAFLYTSGCQVVCPGICPEDASAWITRVTAIRYNVADRRADEIARLGDENGANEVGVNAVWSPDGRIIALTNQKVVFKQRVPE